MLFLTSTIFLITNITRIEGKTIFGFFEIWSVGTFKIFGFFICNKPYSFMVPIRKITKIRRISQELDVINSNWSRWVIDSDVCYIPTYSIYIRFRTYVCYNWIYLTKECFQNLLFAEHHLQWKTWTWIFTNTPCKENFTPSLNLLLTAIFKKLGHPLAHFASSSCSRFDSGLVRGRRLGELMGWL